MPYICLLQDKLTQLNFTFDKFKRFAARLQEEPAHVSLSETGVSISCNRGRSEIVVYCSIWVDMHRHTLVRMCEFMFLC